jgi:tetratricopeptide (TPR) repeat protein
MNFLFAWHPIKPLVIIFEDLHWADLTTIEFLKSHFRLVLENPILFINVFRPDYKETSERIMKITQDRYAPVTVNIKLNPLTEEDCEGMIHNLLKISGFPLQVKDQIINRTGGNPFFIEEIIRSFIDEGIIVVHHNRFEVTGKIKSVEIPATINEVIMSRVDRLDEDSRSLLKTASVIGRSFYYRILTKMVAMGQDLDDRLAKMEEIQLITKHKKNEELAYLFKHALAQEATYQSILLKKRKDLHLKTAHTIEKIFSDRLSEFYGILAWHYSKGEDFKNAEEYLLKAGEEAMRTSASTEAINYFREALALYSNEYGETADWEKIANMEKNIGIALYNKGRFGEALPYFDSVLSYYGANAKHDKLGTVMAVISGLFHLLVALFLTSLKWRRIPTSKDNELNSLLQFQLGCTGFVASDRMLFLSARFIKRMTCFNLSKSENGIEGLCLSTVFLSYAGVSFALHKKLLDNIREKVNQQSIVERMAYEFTSIINYRMEGHYASYRYDNVLVEDAFGIGYLQNTSYYLIFSFFIELGQGNFSHSEKRIEKLEEMAKLFDNETVEGWLFMARAKLWGKQRKLNQALIEAEKFIQFCKKVDDKSQLLWAYATNAYIKLLMGDVEVAEQSMEQVNQADGGQNVFKTTKILNQLLIHLYHFEKAVHDQKEAQKKIYSKKLKFISKAALNIASKIADDRIEIMKGIGLYGWLSGKHHRALKWWAKGIAEGERLNAKPELARLYFEAGKRMTREKGKALKLNGLNSEELLKRAEEIFGEIDLEEDLRELHKFKILQSKGY